MSIDTCNIHYYGHVEVQDHIYSVYIIYMYGMSEVPSPQQMNIHHVNMRICIPIACEYHGGGEYSIFMAQAN